MTDQVFDQREDIHRLSRDPYKFYDGADRFVVENTTGINPTEFKVLILPKEVEQVTKGGIILAPQTTDSEKYATIEGTIIAVSPLAFTYVSQQEWDENNAVKPKPGDRVIFAKYAGVRHKAKDGQEYLLVNDKDIVAVLDDQA